MVRPGPSRLVCKSGRADFDTRIAGFPADLRAANVERGNYNIERVVRADNTFSHQFGIVLLALWWRWAIMAAVRRTAADSGAEPAMSAAL